MGDKQKDSFVDRSRRLERFRAEVDRAGGPQGFMDAFKISGEANYVSQILNGHRGFGERAARSFEKKCGWPAGYLDWSDEAGNDEIFKMIRSFPPETRAQLEGLIRNMYEQLVTKRNIKN